MSFLHWSTRHFPSLALQLLAPSELVQSMQACDDMLGGGACVVVGGGGEASVVVGGGGGGAVLEASGSATGDVAGSKTLPLIISTP